MTRRHLIPAADVPILYFGFAHLCLASALAVLVVRPDLPGGFFHHPRMVALVHLVTLGWITSSILGAFYIVGPLALRMALPAGRMDRAAFVAHAIGVTGMVSHFWLGEYSGMAWSALLVLYAVTHVATRALTGLRRAPVPWPVKLHVALAFGNMLAASLFGILVGLNRLSGWFAWPPMSSAFAHAHLAAVGWVVMMVVGLSYRLIPMIVPAAMPTSPAMAGSAVLLEAGTLALVAGLLSSARWLTGAAVVMVSGLAVFVSQVRQIVTKKLPPPAALPRPDWATWQTHVAFGWLLVAATVGLTLTLPIPLTWTVPLGWIYGVAGLIGFLAQVVMGIQGRLLPLHAWYRMFDAAGEKPPGRSAHTLASPALAKAILITWTAGVPLLMTGLVLSSLPLVSLAGACLLAGVALNAAQGVTIETGGA